MGSMMQDLAFAIPGVDEAMSFAEIMKFVAKLPTPWIDKITSSQTCQVDGIFGHRVRYRTNWTYSAFPFVPHRIGEGPGQTKHAQRTIWAYDQTNVEYDGRPAGFPGGYVCKAGVYARRDQRSQHTIQRPCMRQGSLVLHTRLTRISGKDHVRLRLHLGIPVVVRDGASRSRIDSIRDRHAQHRRESAAFPQDL